MMNVLLQCTVLLACKGRRRAEFDEHDGPVVVRISAK